MVSLAEEWNLRLGNQAVLGLLGANLIALLISIILLGVLTCQVVLYFQRYRDGRITQLVVVGTFLGQAVVIVCTAQSVYRGLITSYGKSEIVTSMLHKFYYNILFILAVIQSSTVQGFLVWRVWSLSRVWWLTGVASACVFCQLSFGLVSVVISIAAASPGVLSERDPLAIAFGWLSSEIIATFVITFIIALLLLAKSPEVEASNTMLRKLVQYTVSTGLITGVFSVACLVCLERRALKALIVLAVIYPSTYPIAMLANLHSRTLPEASDEKQHQRSESDEIRSRHSQRPSLTWRSHTDYSDIYPYRNKDEDDDPFQKPKLLAGYRSSIAELNFPHHTAVWS